MNHQARADQIRRHAGFTAEQERSNVQAARAASRVAYGIAVEEEVLVGAIDALKKIAEAVTDRIKAVWSDGEGRAVFISPSLGDAAAEVAAVIRRLDTSRAQFYILAMLVRDSGRNEATTPAEGEPS